MQANIMHPNNQIATSQAPQPALEEVSQPPISVVISTRNRGDSIVAGINSILANDYPHFELRVIDQSDTDSTRRAVEPFVSDPRFFYTHSQVIGSSNGRNLGISQCANEFIAITDDDCVVSPNWLAATVRALQLDPHIGAVYGNVVSGEYDQAVGFIPGYECKKPFLAKRASDRNKVRGIGACMGLRRSVWEAIHGYDPVMGPGAKFKAGEDWDFTMKTLAAGYYVYETPEICLVHNGFRNWEEGRRLAAQYGYGIGGMVAKYIKRRRWFVLKVIGFECFYIYGGIFIRNLVFKRRLSGLTSILYFWKGLAEGLLTRFESSTGNYALPQR